MFPVPSLNWRLKILSTPVPRHLQHADASAISREDLSNIWEEADRHNCQTNDVKCVFVEERYKDKGIINHQFVMFYRFVI